MPETPTPPRAPAARGLRIVLFGMPAAGKSSLLGALAQSAQTQGHALHGQLIDHTKGLAELKRQVYEDRSRETLEEVVLYPVTLEPLPNAEGPAAGPVEATLVDCDGRVANEILSRQQGPDAAAEDGPLARAIRGADTLVLVVDAAADPALLQKDFNHFARFLRLLEQGRGRRAEIAGLPVYLVLSKCDLLAKKDDTPAAWMQRIEERKRTVAAKFQEYLAAKGLPEGLAFGKLDLHLWATAVRRPELGDRPAKPEPYGVAELFRQCFASARAFNQRRTLAARRLRYTVGGVVGFVGILVLLGAGFFLTRPSVDVLRLENELRPALPAAGADPAERFQDAAARLKVLQRAQKDPDFEKLPQERQLEVLQLSRELERYVAYRKEFYEKVQSPRFATSEEELQKIEKTLAALPLPPKYEAAWAETDVAQTRRQWLNDVQKVREGVAELEAWYRQQAKSGKELAAEGGRLIAMSSDAKTSRGEWLTLTKEFLAQKPPRPEEARLPGAFGVTWATVYQFRPVVRARSELDEVKKNVERIRTVVAQT